MRLKGQRVGEKPGKAVRRAIFSASYGQHPGCINAWFYFIVIMAQGPVWAVNGFKRLRSTEFNIAGVIKEKKNGPENSWGHADPPSPLSLSPSPVTCHLSEAKAWGQGSPPWESGGGGGAAARGD